MRKKNNMDNEFFELIKGVVVLILWLIASNNGNTNYDR